jgi:hypothetical protein
LPYPHCALGQKQINVHTMNFRGRHARILRREGLTRTRPERTQA